MLQLASQQKLLLAIKPVDFRKGLDSLIGLCQSNLKQDPYTGLL